MKSDDEQGRCPIEWTGSQITPWMKATISSINKDLNLREKFMKINQFDWELENRMIPITIKFENVLNRLIYSILGSKFINIVYEHCKKFKDFIERKEINFDGYLVNAMRLVILNAMPRTLRRIINNKHSVSNIFGNGVYAKNWQINLVSEQLFVPA